VDKFGADCTIEKLEVIMEELFSVENKRLEDLARANEEYKEGLESALQPLHELQKELIKQKIIIEEYEALQQKTTALLFQLEETTKR